jgi:glycosyltransferase involved in cell wall biosynthesis
MKILLTADPMIPVPPAGYGGIERIVDALLRFYRAQGHEVGLVSHPGSTAQADARFPWPCGPGGTLRNALYLRRAVRKFRPDLLHSFSRLAYLAPLMISPLPKIMSYQRHAGGRQISWAARIGGRSLRFTGCSEFICSMGRPSGGEWRVIPNFVEPDKYIFVPKVSSDAPLVFLSRIESIKGPDVAIAIARAVGRRLILAGNPAEQGSEREFWERKIAPHLGRDGIEWVGEVNDLQKSELLGRAAALVLPIRWDEPFGIVFVEALAAGTPVITCARGGAPEIIEPGVTGFFVRDAKEGSEAVRRLEELDRAACRRAAETRFSLRTCAKSYLELYREMVADRR